MAQNNIVIKLTIDGKGNDPVLQQLEGGIQKIVNSAMQAKNNTSSFFQNLMGSFTGINQGLELARKAVDFFSKPVTIAMDMEQAQVSFEVLLGSAEAADKMISQFKEDAAKTPYEFTDLQDAGKVLLNFGITADKVRPTLMMLGDIAGGNSQKFQQLALVMGQVASAGKLQGQDLLQLINAGFNPLQEISRTTGKSMASLRKEMEDGKISFSMVEGAFKSVTSEGGRFFGMMDKQSLTLGGLMSTLSDNINQGLASFANSGLFQEIKGVIKDIGKLIEDNKAKITAAINTIGQVMGGVFKGIIGLVKILGSGLATLYDFKDAIMQIALVLGIFTLAISAETIALKLMYTWDLLVANAKRIWAGVQWLLNAAVKAFPLALVISLIVGLVAIIYKAIEQTIGWGKAWAYIKSSLEIAWLYIKAFGNSVLNFAGGLLKILTFPFQVMYQTAAEMFQKIGVLIRKLLAGDFTGIWNELSSGISTGYSNAMSSVASSFKEALNSFNGLAGESKKIWAEAVNYQTPQPKKAKAGGSEGGGSVSGSATGGDSGDDKKKGKDPHKDRADQLKEEQKHREELLKLQGYSDESIIMSRRSYYTKLETLYKGHSEKLKDIAREKEKDQAELNKIHKDQQSDLADEVLELNVKANEKLTAENEKYLDKEMEDMEKVLDLKEQLLYTEEEMKLAYLEKEYEEKKALIEAEISDETEKARILAALKGKYMADVAETEQDEYAKKIRRLEKENRTAAVTADSIRSGFDSMYGNIIMKQREAKDNWDAAWLSMKNTALNALGEMLSAALRNYILDTIAFDAAEKEKTAVAAEGSGARIGLAIWENVKKIAVWIAEQTAFIAKEAAMTAAFLAQSAIRIGKSIAEAGAALVKAVASAIAGMGPLGLLLGGGMVAAGVALFGQIKKAFGFAEGGRFKKGQSGYIEGYHDEIIAPERTFVDIMRTELIPRIVSSVKIPPSSLIASTTPSFAGLGGFADPALSAEIAKLNQNFEYYAKSPNPAVIGERENRRAIREAMNAERKRRG